MDNMEMRVSAIGVDQKSGDPVVVLYDTENTKYLPIWIGLPEARAITMAANKIVSTRPLTHDLLFSTITQLGYQVKQILIDNIQAQTFMATIYLTPKPEISDRQALEIDARPSDAIALALTAGAPVLVSNAVVEKAAFPVKGEKENEEFSEFVQTVKASDFKLSEKVELPPEEDEEADAEE